MKLCDVKEVKEESAVGVNPFLKKGYVILKILKLSNKEDESIVYVLGK